MPLPLSFRGGAVRFSFFPVAFGCLVVFGCCGFFPFGNKFLIIEKKKISSLGLMIKHEQFYLNYSTNIYFQKLYFFENTVSGIVKPSVTIPKKITNHRFI